MGKKRLTVLGSENETEAKAKRAIQLEQKRLREGKSAKAPGLKGGQRVVDTASESLIEYETLQAKQETSAPEPTAEAPKSTKKVHHRSSAYKTAKSLINSENTYTISQALDLLQKTSLTKFVPTVELHITLKTPGFSQTVELPYSTGKTRKIAIADDATVALIEKGTVNFDVLLASPAQMPKLVKLAKTLGPKGLMPNPKNGTVTDNPEKRAAELAKGGTLPYKAEAKFPIIHLNLGPVTQNEQDLIDNVTETLRSIGPSKIKSAFLSCTHTPSVRLSLSSI